MTRLLTLLALAGAVALGQPKNDDSTKKAADAGTAPVITLARGAAKKQTSALAYRLLPDPLDVSAGNAAPVWVRAMLAARAVRHKWTEKQYSWDHAGKGGTALKNLPRKELRDVLTKYAGALRLADQAARRSRCDWQRGELTVQNLQDPAWLPLEEIQGMRELLRLVSLRCRLELAEGKYDEAARGLQTGMAMARHMNTGELMIQDLVSVAFGAIMLSRVEEWVQRTGSPNLYWALTDLPRPLVDVRKSIRHELNTIYRSFPAFRGLRKKKLTAAEATKLLGDVFGCLGGPGEGRPWAAKGGVAPMVKKEQAGAKKALVAAGWAEKDVDALPAAQVVALAFIERYERTRDEVVKWLTVPAWQGLAKLEKVTTESARKAKQGSDLFLGLLLPTISKTYGAQLRLERYVAGLRGGEALRQHVGDTGKLPAKWADIEGMPGPIDPFTGKGLGSYYSVKDGKGVLAVPPPPGMPALLGRRFEITAKK